MDVTHLTRPVCLPARAAAAAAAAPVPPARTLRIRLNTACLSRPDAAAAAKKSTRPDCSSETPPPAKRLRRSVAADEKVVDGSASAPVKIWSNLLLRRPCSRGDEAPRSPAAARKKAGTPNSNSGQANRRGGSSPFRVLIATKKRQQVAGDGAASSSSSLSPQSPDSEGVRALLARARPASDAIRRRDMERLRAQARWEMEQVVQTVEFNDPFISPQDVLPFAGQDQG
ncbi:hypothetical protein HU200_022706 [Digitaria exilis]|uniref:Uncharacterized protein n=1 Tax=Digitaria exilis TaxID=1010633 RepID=A0A835C4T2_9POAL|nr:hypothetical protein HU200_022706 [Digitaria exilis]